MKYKFNFFRVTNTIFTMNKKNVNHPYDIFYSGYTIRTETTVRTTEIKFYLGKTFSESTIDGRITDTTPIRDKNIITLNQKGNQNKKNT